MSNYPAVAQAVAHQAHHLKNGVEELAASKIT